MKTYLHLTQVPLPEVVGLARRAEELGFAGVSLAEHLAAPAEMTTPYPYGVAPWQGVPEWGDPWVTAAAITQATRRLRVLTSVYVLPLRPPLLVAKAVATAAVLSGGRIGCGVGAGWLREEFDLAGEAFGGRGARMDEAIEILRLAWTGETVEFHGAHYDLAPFTMRPAPPAPVPILVGGAGPRALRRAALLGDGWIAPAGPAAELAAAVAGLREARADAGRTGPFEVVAWSEGPGDLDALARAGADAVRVRPWALHPGLSRAAALERYAAGAGLSG
ncbi:TIGR03619 family F420-dependent LLM class oxidoreductase [Spirillospora sp. NBC_01491]|uniref:TIGR03619 family F420-dependent LLM class oxidoreductase n=1 Tax=Spirillospora sp. NBC_01491 TaxID=2976007 RepID=UPI002E31E734|nr:TIGR03619 family F420-dependent LLM class oxidoreductase [Spirillospora sp. NBC_01491]